MPKKIIRSKEELRIIRRDRMRAWRDKCKNDSSFQTKRKDPATWARKGTARNARFMKRYLWGKKCVTCNNSDRRCLEFDHVNREDKKYNISKISYSSWSLETLKAEIRKCRILCANCHRIHTWEQREEYKMKNNEKHWNGTQKKNKNTLSLAIVFIFFTFLNISQAQVRRGEGGDLPPGTVITFAGSTCPYGFLSADGSSISRTTYAKLFAAIGTAHGFSSASVFNIPDYRGNVLRGVDGSKGNDPDKLIRTAMNPGGATGNNVGSIQVDSMQGHSHYSGGNSGRTVTAGSGYNAFAWIDIVGGGPVSDGVNGTPRVSSETRMKNAYVNYCIKY